MLDIGFAISLGVEVVDIWVDRDHMTSVLLRQEAGLDAPEYADIEHARPGRQPQSVSNKLGGFQGARTAALGIDMLEVGVFPGFGVSFHGAMVYEAGVPRE